MPYGTLQGLKRSSTSTQAAKRLEAYMGLHPVLLPQAVTRRGLHTNGKKAHTCNMLAARGNHIRAPKNSTHNANLRAFCFSAAHTATRTHTQAEIRRFIKRKYTHFGFLQSLMENSILLSFPQAVSRGLTEKHSQGATILKVLKRIYLYLRNS